MRKVGALLVACTLLITLASAAQAHVLESNGSVGAVMHIDPNDAPVTNAPSTFFFEFKDKQNKFSPGACSCTFTILEAGKVLFTQPLFQNNAAPSLSSGSASYIFPKPDVYTVQITGTPITTGAFQSFTLNYDVRVEAGATPISSSATSWLSLHLVHIVLIGGAVLFMILFILKEQRMKNKTLISLFLAVGAVSLFALPALAHVVVKPSQVGVAAFQTFSIGVPNEKEVAVTAVKILIPEGLKEVSPNVKPGWKIDIKKSGDDVTEISWTGGNIPTGQRDDFYFSAQAPATETSLNWKAYQTYQDGSMVSWDQAPAGSDDATGDKGPYSVTKVINDLVPSPTPVADSTATDHLPFILSIVALVVAVLALGKATMSHSH